MNEEKALRYLGLAVKAGGIIIGTEECEKAVKRGRGGLLLLAADAAPNAVKRAAHMAESGRVRQMKTVHTKAELAAALGRSAAVAVALVTNRDLARAYITASMEQEERI